MAHASFLHMHNDTFFSRTGADHCEDEHVYGLNNPRMDWRSNAAKRGAAQAPPKAQGLKAVPLGRQPLCNILLPGALNFAKRGNPLEATWLRTPMCGEPRDQRQRAMASNALVESWWILCGKEKLGTTALRFGTFVEFPLQQHPLQKV